MENNLIESKYSLDINRRRLWFLPFTDRRGRPKRTTLITCPSTVFNALCQTSFLFDHFLYATLDLILVVNKFLFGKDEHEDAESHERASCCNEVEHKIILTQTGLQQEDHYEASQPCICERDTVKTRGLISKNLLQYIRHQGEMTTLAEKSTTNPDHIGRFTLYGDEHGQCKCYLEEKKDAVD